MKRLRIYLLYLLIAGGVTFLTTFFTYEIPPTTMFIGNVSPLGAGLAGFPLYFLYKTSEGQIIFGQILIDLLFWFSIAIMIGKAWDLLKTSEKN